ncbi:MULTISPECIES: ABC transporter ATP-binding protein [Lysinibacillus]|uniref:Energy-coupling factor ABC transporter ATP-binding protein n=2 Tax=Lysinibacillus TaxID=400634 RepID=A0ABY2T4F2_9BACI|nr:MULTISPECIES: ABC transporter ATP-binding protein [Lysinibacillus]AHN21831.1 cobalt ABC transporter ATP-binding protein [Lysinibacillus varians]TKI47361.1 energy-coupling factor ABC transporter ATP-binding protein [Lysinibacillus tabacifolii]TKI51515.1 energy-coupling factor ABC transporter ATP-binding protein [Lysinibacillus varians]
MAIVKIDNVSFTYPNEAIPILKNINLTIQQGEFIVLIGQSGCGKSTLLRHFKRELRPHGTVTGNIFYKDCDLEKLNAEVAATDIGYVFQNPDNQIVTDKVWHELAFGLESLGLDSPTIRRRVAEMANFFGIEKWFHQKTIELSGGQKQLLNLASIMVMQPKLLLLDEPTSQLDPIAALEFIQTLHRLNKELGITIILIEHRLEEVLPLADRVLIMDEGSILFDGPPKEILNSLPANHAMITALPAATKIFHLLNGIGPIPLTIREGQRWLSNQQYNCSPLHTPHTITQNKSDVVLEAKDVAFRYEKKGRDIVNHFNLQVKGQEFLTIIGGNGTGKSTVLAILSGLQKPYHGKIFLFSKALKSYSSKQLYQQFLTVLPQNPKSLFVQKTVLLELNDMAQLHKVTEAKIQETVQLFNLTHLLNRHPYDLSGGEQQKLALAKILLIEPKILLLDEPTKGLDAHSKEELAEILKDLQTKGTTIIMVTHDIEFSAQYSDRCALFFDGSIVSEDEPRAFYSGNNFYTTAAHRISRDILSNAITCEDVVTLCKKTFD